MEIRQPRKTTHRIIFENSNNMAEIPQENVELVVTSPPYPMIEMWDKTFSEQNPKIGKALNHQNGALAFELMHTVLDATWSELWRVLKPGGIVCINIGDATRSLDGEFALYPNHSRIISHMLQIGFAMLPEILWRKQGNAPNKFMGSGMLPPSAYVTLEHEFILIFRKGGKRAFKKPDEKRDRRESAFFWEERNLWFSDIWTDLKGTSQALSDKNVRTRSGSFPFEIPYRLINMFSVKGDTVLDPFFGIGTTLFAAMTAGRNSIGYELEQGFQEMIVSKTARMVSFSNDHIRRRINAHSDFVKKRLENKNEFKYINANYHFPVMTKQEQELILNELISVQKTDDKTMEVTYSEKVP